MTWPEIIAAVIVSGALAWLIAHEDA